MDGLYEEKYHGLEDSNWWFKSRREIIIELIKSLALPTGAKILEVGCSGGPLLRDLKKQGFDDVVGIDVSQSAVDICLASGFGKVQLMTGSKTSFPDQQFDLIVASDVLEHIEDDRLALREWQRLLAPDGYLIIFVPTFNFLWSSHDKVNCHYRRYSGNLLRRQAIEAGLSPIRHSYWDTALFVPVALWRLMQRFLLRPKRSEGQLYSLPVSVNNLLLKLLRSENRLLKYIDLPFGISFFLVAKKHSIK